MVRRMPKNNSDVCYFCSVNVSGLTLKTRSFIQYPNLKSDLQLIPHSSYLLQYLRPSRFLTAKAISFQLRILRISMKNLMLQEDLGRFPNCSHRLIWMTWWGILIYRKIQLNYLLPDWKVNLLAPGTAVSFYRNAERDLVQFFRMEDDFVFCDDINGLLNAMGCEYEPAPNGGFSLIAPKEVWSVLYCTMETYLPPSP